MTFCVNEETREEIEFLANRIEQLRSLQHNQRHLAFIVVHIQEHIDKLEVRIGYLLQHRAAS